MLTDQQQRHASEILQKASTLGTPAAGVCIQVLGEESLDWEPEILSEAIVRATGKAAHPDVLQRIYAISSLLDNDMFFRLPEVFHSVCATLLDPDEHLVTMTKPPTPLEVMWSCTEAQLLLGDSFSVRRFTPNVRRYCGAILLFEDLRVAPQGLEFADFPESIFPDTDLMSDEVMASSFWKDQEDRLTELSKARTALIEGYADQMSELAKLGADAGKTEALHKKLLTL